MLENLSLKIKTLICLLLSNLASIIYLYQCPKRIKQIDNAVAEILRCRSFDGADPLF
jgi:hypothetical protein